MEKPHPVWATDIPSMSVLGGRFDRCAIIDMDRRLVVGFPLSHTMPVDLCLEALYKAIENDGCPQRLHTDQGSPLTSRE